MLGSLLLSPRRRGAPSVSLRKSSRWIQIALAVPALAGACTVENDPLFDDEASLAPLAGRTGNLPNFSQRPNGSGGRAGASAGTGGGEGNPIVMLPQGQNAADAGTLPGAGAGISGDAGSDAAPGCESAGDCDDANECTLDECAQGSCGHAPAGAGVACGSSTLSECTLADSCDGAGKCAPNNLPAETACGRIGVACAADRCDGAGSCVERALAVDAPCGVSTGCGQPTCNAEGACEPHAAANGSACPGGSCSVGACVQGQRVGCPQVVVTSVPFETSWSSAGLPDLFEGDCESNDTPDFAVLFVVPAAGRYRFEATGSPDSVLALTNAACSAGNGTELSCNDDLNDNNINSRLDVTLTAAQTLTVYVSEFADGRSGQGTLRITAL